MTRANLSATSLPDRSRLPGEQGPPPGGIASSRSVVPEAHDKPDPALRYIQDCRPVRGARGRAPSLSPPPPDYFKLKEIPGQHPSETRASTNTTINFVELYSFSTGVNPGPV